MIASAVYDALMRSILAREFEKAFLEATGLPVELVPSGELSRFFPSQQNENPFCRLMVQFKESCAACQQAHDELQRKITDSLLPQTICCFAGLAEFAVPVVMNGQHVATLVGGRVFPNKPTQAQFAQIRERLRSWGLQNETERFQAQFFQSPVIPPKQFQASVQLLTILTKFLVEDLNHNLLTTHDHDEPCIVSAKNFILAQANEPLHLRDVAEHIHVSTQYFCKFFKKATGMGFSEFLGRARVENAKQALANSVLSIGEVADQAGFGSLSQFNRTFRRYVGCSPKEYRASLQ